MTDVNVQQSDKLSLMQRLDRLEGQQDPKKKSKEFKFGFWQRMKANRSMKKKSKQILAILVKRNKTMWPMYLKHSDGMIEIGEARYNYDPEYVLLWKGRVSAVLIYEWHLNPISPTSDPINVDPSTAKDNVSALVVMLRAVQQKMNETKKKGLGGFIWIFVIIGIGILAYLLFSGKLKGGG